MIKKNIDKTFNINNIIIIFLIIIIFITMCIIYNKFNKEHYANTDYFDCYIKLVDINPQLVEQYMKFNNRHVSKGNCTDATLHVTIDPCPTDTNGIPSTSCMESATLTSSKGNPLEFTYKVSPENMTKFFGINP
jgi:hypothetical protein